MPCPKCDSDNLTVSEEHYEENNHYEEYICDDCGCVFSWTSKREIVEEPEEEDTLTKMRKTQKELENFYAQQEEEEEDEDEL